MIEQYELLQNDMKIMGIVKDNLEKQYEEETQVKDTQITNLEARIDSMKAEMANTQKELVIE